MGGMEILYVHINVRIPPLWYFMQSVLSPMWDLLHYLENPQYLDDLHPTLVVTTVDLPPTFLLNK